MDMKGLPLIFNLCQDSSDDTFQALLKSSLLKRMILTLPHIFTASGYFELTLNGVVK